MIFELNSFNSDESISQDWYLATCHDYLNFDKKLSKYPSVVSYRIIQSFSQTTFQMSCGYENISNLITYLYVSQSEGDDSVDNILEILF